MALQFIQQQRSNISVSFNCLMTILITKIDGDSSMRMEHWWDAAAWTKLQH